MTKDQVRKLRLELQTVLDEQAKYLGLKFTVGNATMGATVTFKLECATVLADGTVKTREAEDFKRYATAFGLKVDDLGRTIKYAGHQYVVKGLKPSASKFPVLADRDDGKRYCLPTAAVIASVK